MMGKSIIGDLFNKAQQEDNIVTVATKREPERNTEEIVEEKKKTGNGKRGRPSKRTVPIPSAEGVFIRCRVTPEENRAIKTYCVQNDLTVDELIRRAVFKVVNK